jgi:phage terminase Nu1 subunit (DNA packaging protein)
LTRKPASKRKATRTTKQPPSATIVTESRLFSILGLSRLLDVDRSVIERWVKQHGCPVARTGGKGAGNEWKLDVSAVFKWREKYLAEKAIEESGKADDVDEIDRKTKLLKFAAAAGLVAPVDMIEQALERVMAELRQSQMSISARVSRSMAGFPKDRVDAWCALVDTIVRESLQAAEESIAKIVIEPPAFVRLPDADHQD